MKYTPIFQQIKSKPQNNFQFSPDQNLYYLMAFYYFNIFSCCDAAFSISYHSGIQKRKIPSFFLILNYNFVQQKGCGICAYYNHFFVTNKLQNNPSFWFWLLSYGIICKYCMLFVAYRGLFRALSNIYHGVFCEKRLLAVNYSRKKLAIFDVWQGSGYASSKDYRLQFEFSSKNSGVALH